MNTLRQEFRGLWSAFLYFTRLPLPCPQPYDPEDLRRAATYWPLTGWLVGGVVAGLWWLLASHLALGLAAGLALLGGILLTGAMHEDGLADVCDGFGGGSTPERVLEIMKDSAVGAFGAVGLVVVIGLRWQCLLSAGLGWQGVWRVVAAVSCSRGLAICLMGFLDYVRVGPSKARPLAQRLSWGRMVTACLLGLAPFVWLPGKCLLALPVAVLGLVLLGRWFKSRIGGYTGDCLGAAQQVCELLLFIALFFLS